uniref:Uncharacterized protein n=1 Tax=Rhizophora mucronata TaxID=61149 RepID=A0A2P2LSE7_RHIMU
MFRWPNCIIYYVSCVCLLMLFPC